MRAFGLLGETGAPGAPGEQVKSQKGSQPDLRIEPGTFLGEATALSTVA